MSHGRSYNDVTETVGNTPLIALRKLGEGFGERYLTNPSMRSCPIRSSRMWPKPSLNSVRSEREKQDGMWPLSVLLFPLTSYFSLLTLLSPIPQT